MSETMRSEAPWPTLLAMSSVRPLTMVAWYLLPARCSAPHSAPADEMPSAS